MPGIPAGQGVKGKQVKILCDLVTVMGEKPARRKGAATGQPGRRQALGIPQPGNLPAMGTGVAHVPDHEELIVPKAAAPAAFLAAPYA